MSLGLLPKSFGGIRSSSFHYAPQYQSRFLRSFSTSEQKVKILVSTTNDPLFNLATEEWIFRQGDISKQTLYLWRNAPTVVIGRYQNPWKECHLQKMEADNVTLARRYSGGGAVYQDLGNTCFTFLSPKAQFDKNLNTQLICSALEKFNVKAEASGRNDIIINNQKISGSAYKLSGNRCLHHGTLLINVDLDALSKYLNVNKEKLKSKGVSSVRARVTNLKEVNPSIDHDSLTNSIIDKFCNHYGSRAEIEELNKSELEKEPLLRKTYEELKDWNWRFGETPAFEHNLEHRFDWGIIDMHINSTDGRINDIKIFSDCLVPQLVDELTTHLKGATYDKAGIVDGIYKAKSELLRNNELDAAKYLIELETWLIEEL